MKRKVLSVMLATAMTATLFAGCGSDASNADSANSADATASTTEAGDVKTDAAASGSGSVYYLNFKPEQDQQWQDLAAKYTAETGTEVTVITAADGTYEQTLKSEMAKSEAPTLFQVNGPVGLANWKDYCYDLSDSDIYKELTSDDYALKDGDSVAGIGYVIETYGIITNKTVKYTRNNKVMAFLTIEDLVGTVEVVVFPNDYEKNVQKMEEDSKVFIRGKVQGDADKASKLICEKIYSFDDVPKELWVQFETKEDYLTEENEFLKLLSGSRGTDRVIIYVRTPKSIKYLGIEKSVKINEILLGKLYEKYGMDNVKVVEKSIENITKI